MEDELDELLYSEKNDIVQPATLKLKALDLKARLAKLGIANWVNNETLDHIDPISLSNWEDKISKNVANILYRAEEKISIRKGLAHSGLTKRDPPHFNGAV